MGVGGKYASHSTYGFKNWPNSSSSQLAEHKRFNRSRAFRIICLHLQKLERPPPPLSSSGCGYCGKTGQREGQDEVPAAVHTGHRGQMKPSGGAAKNSGWSNPGGKTGVGAHESVSYLLGFYGWKDRTGEDSSGRSRLL